MLIAFAKISLISVLLPLVVSKDAKSVETETTTSQNQEIVFRVVNGKPANLGTVPYQVSLKALMKRRGYSIYMNYCGGSVIAPTKILSAGHCFVKKGNMCQQFCKKVKMANLKRRYAVAGTLRNEATYVKDGASAEQWRKMTKAYVPDGYWFPERDIAIAFTDAPFVFTDYVKVLPLASRTMDYGAAECLVSGYGKINKRQVSAVLLWAKLRLIPKSRCSHIHGRNMRKFICTESKVTDVLEGDSGGPLVCRNTGDPSDKGQGVIVGVVSGARRRRRRFETFFTRVSSYRRFVDGNEANINLPMFHIVWLSLIISNFG